MLTLDELVEVYRSNDWGFDLDRNRNGLRAVLERLAVAMERRYAGRLATPENPWDWLRAIASPPEPEPSVTEAVEAALPPWKALALAMRAVEEAVAKEKR